MDKLAYIYTSSPTDLHLKATNGFFGHTVIIQDGENCTSEKIQDHGPPGNCLMLPATAAAL